MNLPFTSFLLMLLAFFPANVFAQVHYDETGIDGDPWTVPFEEGPDAVTGGWWYNLRITGLRIELVTDRPKVMVARFVFPASPAGGIMQAGDVIIGAGGARFTERHRNGYGGNFFGAHGPVGEFAVALDAAQSQAGNGTLAVEIERGGSLPCVLTQHDA